MSQSKQQFAAVAFAFEAGLGFLAVLVGRGLGFDPLQTLGLDQSWVAWGVACLWGLAAAVPMVVALVVVDRHPRMLAAFKQQVTRVVLPMFEGLSWSEIGAISLAAGVGEELLFRGLLQAGLMAWLDQPWGWALALGLASLVFGVCHWLNLTYAILTAVVGCYLGGLLLLAGNLIAPMVAHGLYDFVAIVYLTRMSRRVVLPPGDADPSDTEPGDTNPGDADSGA